MSCAVDDRVADLLRVACADGVLQRSRRDRVAARYLFSMLAALERIAVLAAERGAGIQDQLEDERVHEGVFRRIARELGGEIHPPEPVDLLLQYLEQLTGEASLAALNVTAEAWLAGVFEVVAHWGLADGLLRRIGDDEARHVREAPRTRGHQEVVANLEDRLLAVAWCPEFSVPLYWFGGLRGVAQIGLRNALGHYRACAELGVDPGPQVVALHRAARAAFLQEPPPSPRPMNDWDCGRWVAFPRGSDVRLHQEPPPSGVFDEHQAEAWTVRAIARVLAKRPQLNVVGRAGQLYNLPAVRIGVRRYHSTGRLMTVYADDPAAKSIDQIVRQLRQRTERRRRAPYRFWSSPVPEDLEFALPPARCAAVVTNCGPFGPIYTGTAPLSEVEGVPIVVALSSARPDGGRNLGFTIDHRVHDGKDACEFSAAVAQEMSR